MLRALMKNGIYQFKNGKLIYVTEGKNPEDCECCSNNPCFVCDESGDNFGKKLIGGTTTISGFPSEIILYGTTISYLDFPSSYAKTTITNLDQLNGSWENTLIRTDNPLTDCMFDSIDKFINISYLFQRVLGIGIDPCDEGIIRDCGSAISTLQYSLSLGNISFVDIISFLFSSTGLCHPLLSQSLVYIPLYNVPGGVGYINICEEDAVFFEEPSYLTLAPCSSTFAVEITFTPRYEDE